jgi:acyl-coenzyme A synthetase/AMP-(fatty) acid ligase
MKVFLADGYAEYSYDSLLADINSRTGYFEAYKYPDLYGYFVNLTVALLNDQPLTLIDADLNEFEIQSLEIGLTINEERPVSAASLETMNSVVRNILASRSEITIFTSGTTGQPKKIVHSVADLTRAVRKGDKYGSDVWAFAYNPTHMAGLQVFFQAFANLNPLINVFNKPENSIRNAINKYGITHISATPTFYRLLTAERVYPEVRRVTLGGEKSDRKLYASLSKLFPNAKINNVYASTEAGSLFASNDENFRIPETIADKIRIENGELLIHKSLLGKSNGFTCDDDYYGSGDIVEWVDEANGVFKFIMRKNELINTGGYKINPNEVEEAVLSISGIMQCRVYGKPNSVLGNILCADVKKETQCSLSETEIRRILSSKLQDFKIPRKIQFVDEISFTRTGKIKRT